MYYLHDYGRSEELRDDAMSSLLQKLQEKPRKKVKVIPPNPFKVQPSQKNVRVVPSRGHFGSKRRKPVITQPNNRRFGVGWFKDKMDPNQQVNVGGTRPNLSEKGTEEDEKLIEQHRESKRPQEPEPPTASEKWWDSLLSARDESPLRGLFDDDDDDDDDDKVSGFESLRELFDY